MVSVAILRTDFPATLTILPALAMTLNLRDLKDSNLKLVVRVDALFFFLGACLGCRLKILHQGVSQDRKRLIGGIGHEVFGRDVHKPVLGKVAEV